MKRTLSMIAFAVASAAFANAQAGELYPLPAQDFAGAPKTRMQVQEELRQAVAGHQIAKGEQSFVDTTAVAATPSTEKVMAKRGQTQGLDSSIYLRG
jgi:hypothetical protein